MRHLLGLVFVFLVSIYDGYGQTPSITSVNPNSGSPGDLVTINGTNFSTTATDNIVYFGTVRATVNSATNSQLSITVPNGGTFQPISVNVNGSVAYNTTPFNLTFSSQPIILANSFSSKVDFGSITGAYDVALGDLDGDGKLDLVISNISNSISVFQNQSTTGSIAANSFSSSVDFSTGSSPEGIALADLDGDGKLDIIVTNSGSNSVSVIQNTSTSGTITASSFAARVNFSTGSSSSPICVRAADIDQDGKPEIITANYGSNAISVFRNVSAIGPITTSSFQAAVKFTTGTSPFSVEAQDLDGDRKPELIVANYSSGNFSVFRNISTSGTITTSSLATRVDFSTGSGSTPIGAKSADLDGDGLSDIITVDYTKNKVSLFRNISSIGNVSFSSQVDFSTGTNPYGIAIGNLDGNNKPDLVIANSNSNTVSVLRNKCIAGGFTTSSLATKINFTTGTKPTYVALGDIDADGKPEIISTNQSSNAISVFRNTVMAPVAPPVISSFSPTSGSIETTIVIQGTGFDPTSANNLVTIGGLNAKVLASTTTTVSAIVPQGFATGGITVTVLEQTATSASNFILLQPPTLISFTPTSGPPGTAVTIAGTNFSSVPTNNAVFFGTTKATVTASTTTQLKVTVPPGAVDQPISVQVNNLAAYSTKPFLITVPSANEINASIFRTRVDFSTGANSNPGSVAVGDLDGDGKSDLAVANASTNTVSVFRNINATTSISTSSFDSPLSFVTGYKPVNISIGDLDGDGLPDLVVVNETSGTISLFKNTSSLGNISFAGKVDFIAGTFPGFVAIGDLDGNGKPELVVTNWGGSTLTIFRNTGTAGIINSGSFAPAIGVYVDASPISIAIGDLDNDGLPDLAVSHYDSPNVAILRNKSTQGTLSFAAKIDLPTNAGFYAVNINIADLDGDNKLDLIVGDNGQSLIGVFQNTSTPGVIAFNNRVDYAAYQCPWVTIIDFDGDGKPDLSSGSAIMKNITQSGIFGSDSFSTLIYLPPMGTTAVAVGDFNGDGKPDMAIASSGGNKISILENHIGPPLPQPPPVPLITNVSPSSGAVGSSVVITGANFSATPSSNIVFFGSTQATVTAANSTQLNVQVPVGASYQPISVEVNGSLGQSKNPFVVTFPSNQIIDTKSFGANVDFSCPHAGFPGAIAIGDLDGDGKPDLVIANYNYLQGISIFRNIGIADTITHTSFASRVDLPVTKDPYGVTISDLDGDGKPEVIVAAGDEVTIFKNNCTAGTITTNSFASGIGFVCSAGGNVVTGDLDNDGKPEIITSMSILKNTTDMGEISLNSFNARVDFSPGNGGYTAIGDMDGDGKLDIAVISGSNNTVSIYRNISSPGVIRQNSLAPKVDFTTDLTPRTVAIGDLDGDGKLDLVTSNQSSISVLRNISSMGTITTASFSAKVDLATSNPVNAVISDLDGDSKPDLLVAYPYLGSDQYYRDGQPLIDVFKNISTSGTINAGSFVAKVGFSNHEETNTSIAAGDLDGDSKPDLVVTSYGTSIISILENTIAPPPSIVSFSPTTGNIGTTVTITGTNFSKTAAQNKVSFNGVTAVVTSSTSTSITTSVPAGATTGLVSLSVNGGITVNSAGNFTVTSGSVQSPVANAATSINQTGFTANWSSVTGATGYQLDISTDNFSTFLTGYNSKAESGTSQIVTGLTAGTTYQYRVRTVASSGTSSNSNVINVTTSGVAITAPLATAATSISSTGFTANWNSVTGATGYQLDISTDNFSTFLTGYNSKAESGTSQIVTGLIAGTTYQYRVRTVASSGTSSNSNVINVTTSGVAITAPLATAATSISSTGFTANWNSVTGATGYQLDISTDNFSTFLTGYNSKAESGTSQIVTGLTAGTTYQYRVRTVASSGTSSNSNVINVTTSGVAITAPLAMAATSISSTGFTANWNSVTGATGYQLDISTDNFSTFLTGYNSKAESGTSQIVTGLTAGTTYQYRVRTVASSGTSSSSNVINVTTSSVAITAPLATAATSISSTGFTATWNGVTGATGYQLDISTDNFSTFLTGYNSKVESGTSQIVSGLTLGVTYQYRVRASNALVSSSNSNIVTVTTSNKTSQTIVFNSVTDVTIGDPPIVLNAFASSGLSVSYKSSITPAAINGTSFMIVLPGRDTITASQPGDATYFAAPSVSQTFCINPAQPSVTISGDNTATPTLTSNVNVGNQWFLNDAPIVGAINKTLNVTSPGVYTVRVTVDDCVSIPSVSIPIIVTGDIASVAKPITLYPNPAHDFIFIMGISESTFFVSITDLLGQSSAINLDRQGDIFIGNVSNLVAGLYFLQVNQGVQVHQLKFIKE